MPEQYTPPPAVDFQLLSLTGDRSTTYTDQEDKTIIYFFKTLNYADKLDQGAFTEEWKKIAAYIDRPVRSLWGHTENSLLIGDRLSKEEEEFLKSRMSTLLSRGTTFQWARVNQEMESKFGRLIGAIRLRIDAKRLKIIGR